VPSTSGSHLTEPGSAILPQFFGCTGGYSNGYVCDPQLDRAMRRAETLQLSAPSRPAALWAQVDHRIADQAYWVPTDRQAASPRARLQTRSELPVRPAWDFIADQVWLR
jgi:ABC-type transport system substrate-binding protein